MLISLKEINNQCEVFVIFVFLDGNLSISILFCIVKTSANVIRNLGFCLYFEC